MTNSTFAQPLPQENRANASAGHDSDRMIVPGKHHIYPEMAPAGLWTTPRELALFLIELQLSFQGQSNKVLNKEMVEEMMTPVGCGCAVRGGRIGLGPVIWEIGTEIYFGHDGENRGFRLFMQAHKNSGVGAVVMTNSDNGNQLINRIIQLIGEVENWPGY